jgi:3-methylcrotonyl-CoA carboxylase alpha subunit
MALLAAAGIVPEGGPADPWKALGGYAHFHPVQRYVGIGSDDTAVKATVTALGDGRWAVSLADGTGPITLPSTAVEDVVRWPGHLTVFEGATGHSFASRDPLEQASEAAAASGGLRAPMPGLVKLVSARQGDHVSKGKPLLVLEAMKMEHTITAPVDGVIASIVGQGEQVEDRTVLVTFEDEGVA